MVGEMIQAIDLCCGAGGWAVAARGLPINFMAIADIAPDCLETWRVNHQTNHPACNRLQLDLAVDESRELLIEIVPRVNLVLGGIPCEVLSCARGSASVTPQKMDRWRRLLDNCLAIVDALRPRWWCMEDVIQIERELPLPLFHGRTVPFRRIDACKFGPQNRLRTYLGDFPAPLADGPVDSLETYLRPGPHQTFADAEKYTVNPTNPNRVYRDYVRILSPVKACPTITSSFSNRGGRQRRSWVIEDQRGRRRILSWQEAAAVQGFPDDYLFVGGITRTSEMIGQAIPIQVGRAILEAIVRSSGQVN